MNHAPYDWQIVVAGGGGIAVVAAVVVEEFRGGAEVQRRSGVRTAEKVLDRR